MNNNDNYRRASRNRLKKCKTAKRPIRLIIIIFVGSEDCRRYATVQYNILFIFICRYMYTSAALCCSGKKKKKLHPRKMNSTYCCIYL